MAALHVLVALCVSALAVSTQPDWQLDQCFVYDGKSALYRGVQTVSTEGRPCEDWSDFHQGSFMTQQSNYCFDIDGSGYPWCYTDHVKNYYEKGRLAESLAQPLMEACNVSHCPTSIDQTPLLHKCYVYNPTTRKALYQGYVATTKSGRQCQRWDQQYPPQHDVKQYFVDMGFRNLGRLANYCRDPTGNGFPWCYTATSTARWEECDVSYCAGQDLQDGVADLTQCYVTPKSGRAVYLGNVSVTVSGKTCQPWKDQSARSLGLAWDRVGVFDVKALKNFCRDFNNSGRPWCYTLSPDIQWEECRVTKCEQSSFWVSTQAWDVSQWTSQGQTQFSTPPEKDEDNRITSLPSSRGTEGAPASNHTDDDDDSSQSGNLVSPGTTGTEASNSRDQDGRQVCRKRNDMDGDDSSTPAGTLTSPGDNDTDASMDQEGSQARGNAALLACNLAGLGFVTLPVVTLAW